MFKTALSIFIAALSISGAMAMPVSERYIDARDLGIPARNAMKREASGPSTDEAFGVRYTILERETETTDVAFGIKYTVVEREASAPSTDNAFGVKYTIVE